jgi:hypothetical protein
MSLGTPELVEHGADAAQTRILQCMGDSAKQ